MFGLINNLFTLVLVLIIGIPVIGFFAYIAGHFAQSLFGGPIWLWIAITCIFGIGLAIEELNKAKSKNS